MCKSLIRILSLRQSKQSQYTMEEAASYITFFFADVRLFVLIFFSPAAAALLPQINVYSSRSVRGFFFRLEISFSLRFIC